METQKTTKNHKNHQKPPKNHRNLCDVECSKYVELDRYINTKNHQKPPTFHCELCDFKCSKPIEWERHINTIKHNWCEKNHQKPPTFHCELCDFKCSKPIEWERHINTIKHNRCEIEMSCVNGNTFTQKNTLFLCDCGKSCISHSELWNHKKSCQSVNKNISEEITCDNKKIEEQVLVDLVKQLVKENSELKTMMIEQQTSIMDKVIDSQHKFFEQTNNLTLELVKNGINNNNNNTTTTNSHNKAFNLNFFLNETCKNAMNITDFIDSIKLQLSDLISIGDIGYVESMSNIIVKKLNDLDETERPIHCTDKKRETIYIKDEDKWEKDDEDKKKLRKVINKVSYKSQKLLPQFKELYPDYNDSDSKRSDQYSKIVIESMDDSNKGKQDKIIKNISKQVLIKK